MFGVHSTAPVTTVPGAYVKPIQRHGFLNRMPGIFAGQSITVRTKRNEQCKSTISHWFLVLEPN